MSPRAKQSAPPPVPEGAVPPEAMAHAPTRTRRPRRPGRPRGLRVRQAAARAEQSRLAQAKARAAAKEAARAPRISLIRHEEILLELRNSLHRALSQRDEAYRALAPAQARIAQLERYILDRIVPVEPPPGELALAVTDAARG